MISRQGLTAARLLSRPANARSLLRSTPRRFESGQTMYPQGRVAAKQHAEATGELKGAADNEFNRERLAVKHHAAESSDFWRKLSLYVVIPCLFLASANTWVQWNEHWEHQAHMPPLSERPQYAYMNLRTKAYPWGDGDKTLFWNDNYNYHKKDE